MEGALVYFPESMESASCRGKDGEVRQEVSGEASLLAELRSSARRSSSKFHGKKDVGLAGAFPPLAAQASKYQFSHVRGLIFQRASVAKSEKSIIARRPDHSDPLP